MSQGSGIGRLISLLITFLGLIVFYVAIYAPHDSSFVNGDKHRLLACAIGLLIAAGGLTSRILLKEKHS